uniref:Uncharacterized protein n=1 Tax=Rhipicephalus microplus TaxID=6941 RepID=A0A6M2DCV9_RHIMP
MPSSLTSLVVLVQELLFIFCSSLLGNKTSYQAFCACHEGTMLWHSIVLLAVPTFPKLLLKTLLIRVVLTKLLSPLIIPGTYSPFLYWGLNQ